MSRRIENQHLDQETLFNKIKLVIIEFGSCQFFNMHHSSHPDNR